MASCERIPALDGWRAVAIGAVLVSHGFLLAATASRDARVVDYAAGYLGGLGVALFFAISGYLITTLLLGERAETGRMSLGAFYTRRAFRILPPAYVYVTALLLLKKNLLGGELFSASFFFSNYWPHRSWWTQHFWSLSMEEHFYLLWPAALALGGAKRALRAAAAVAGAIIFWRWWSPGHVHLAVPALQRTDMRLDAFLYAGALAIALHASAPEVSKTIRAILVSRWFGIGATVTLASVAVWSIAGSIPALSTLVQSILLPGLLVSVILRPQSRVHRILESAVLRWVGRVSYGLYLWQQLFLVGHAAPTVAAAARAFLPHLAQVFVIAAASYYLYERRLLAYGRRISLRIAGRANSRFVSTANGPLSDLAKRNGDPSRKGWPYWNRVPE